MDPTLAAILAALYEAHRTIELARTRIADLEAKNQELELARAALADGTSALTATLDEANRGFERGLPPGWHLVKLP